MAIDVLASFMYELKPLITVFSYCSDYSFSYSKPDFVQRYS